MRQSSLRSFVCFAALVLCSHLTHASELETLLTAKKAPSGVVFEIVSEEPGLLQQLLPTIKSNIQKLRERFPDLPVAVVSHGTEQFDLTIKNSKNEAKSHQLVKELVDKEKIDVHVCATHASWYGVMPEDFPDYVNVSATGPGQINDYEEMGYEVIVLTE